MNETTEVKKIDTDIQLQCAVGCHYWTSGASLVKDTYVAQQLKLSWQRIDALEVELQRLLDLADYDRHIADFNAEARGW